MKHFLSQPFTLDRTVRTLLLTVLVLLVLWGLSTIWSVILPFLLAGIFAYVVMPIVRFFQYKLRLRFRGLAVLLTFILLGGLVWLGLIYLIPSIREEIEKTLHVISSYSSGRDLVSQLLPPEIRRYFDGSFNLGRYSRGLSLEQLIENTKIVFDQLGSIISGTLSVFSWGFVFLIGLMYFIFILLDFEGLARGLLSLFPISVRPTARSIFKDLDYYMNSYFRGQALVALSVGILLSVGFNIIGLPMATAMGIFIGLLNFIPYMQALGIIPLALACLLMAAQTGENAFFCLLLGFGVLMIVQVLQDMFIVPRIMGQSMGMRPSLILLVLTIWGSLFGFFGMLIALPATMFGYNLYMRYILQDAAYIAQSNKQGSRRHTAKPQASAIEQVEQQD